jgi:hypothetical protein
MRQALLDLGTGPELATKVAFDPRADDNRRMIWLGRRTVTIRRRLCGMKMHLSVPVETYLGVVMAREGRPDGVLYRITLAHPDPDLSVTLKESRSRSAMIRAWHTWTAYFAVPVVHDQETATASRSASPGILARAPRHLKNRIGAPARRRIPSRQKSRRGLRVAIAKRYGREFRPRP